jgi:molybdopterin molybdotransferase
VIGESRAGTPADRQLGDGEAIRVSTGAAVPVGAEAVIRQEDVDVEDGQEIVTRTDLPAGMNVRLAGEDLRSGERVLESGRKLGVAELGAAVAAGAGSLTAARRPRVTILGTGDELRAPGEPLGPGEIHNSNAPMLAALATRCGAQVLDAGRLPDDLERTKAGLREALEQSDVVAVSGGVSVGPHDHVKAALASLGVDEVFWGVALQPGKPTWFGERDGKLVFGLPGNPVSAFVTFVLFACPALGALQGTSQPQPSGLTAVLGVAVKRNPEREQAIRVRLQRSDGATTAIPTGPQGSNMVSSLLGAEALAFIPAGDGELAQGTSVALEPLPG